MDCKFHQVHSLREVCSYNVEHTDHYSGLRMEAWNGATTISLGYCDGSYTSKEAHTFLHDIKGFMMALVG